MRGRQRSWLATGAPREFFHPRARHPTHHLWLEAVDDIGGVAHDVNPTGEGTERLQDRRDLHALIGRPRLAWPLSYSSVETAHAQPPGPGLPMQAPSVNTTVVAGDVGSSKSVTGSVCLLRSADTGFSGQRQGRSRQPPPAPPPAPTRATLQAASRRGSTRALRRPRARGHARALRDSRAGRVETAGTAPEKT